MKDRMQVVATRLVGDDRMVAVELVRVRRWGDLIEREPEAGTFQFLADLDAGFHVGQAVTVTLEPEAVR